MITLTIIWLILSAIGAIKFWVYEEEINKISIFFSIPLCISIIVVPTCIVMYTIYLIIKYLP